jgi:hypothetical protein
MSGQRRALLCGALACALALAGCTTDSPGPTVDAMPASQLTDLCGLPSDGALTPQEDGGLSFTYSNGTTARITFANRRCVLDTYRLFMRPQLAANELGFLYDYYQSSLAPCLGGFGYPLLAPPSRRDFVASGGNWSPWDAVFTPFLDVSEIRQLSINCPMYPPGSKWAAQVGVQTVTSR